MSDGEEQFLREVGARLAKARTDAGFTHAGAAKALGESRPQTLGDREAGKGNFAIANLFAMCRLYRVSADWILGLSEEPKIPPNHAIINRAIELAALQCDSYAELKEEALATDSYGVDGVQFGYTIPGGYEVIPREEYDRRIDAVRRRLERLRSKEKGSDRGKK